MGCEVRSGTVRTKWCFCFQAEDSIRVATQVLEFRRVQVRSPCAMHRPESISVHHAPCTVHHVRPGTMHHAPTTYINHSPCTMHRPPSITMHHARSSVHQQSRGNMHDTPSTNKKQQLFMVERTSLNKRYDRLFTAVQRTSVNLLDCSTIQIILTTFLLDLHLFLYFQ